MVDRLVNSEVNARRVAGVEQCFGSAGKPLNQFGRVLVGEGVLVKMCRKKPKQRQFFLFNDILVYGNIIISKKRYNKQHILPLEDVKLEDLEDEEGEGGARHGWVIRTPSKSFAVYAATATEKKEWTMHIERCVHDLIHKGNKKPATTHAAVWIPDAEAARCMACGRTQFSLVQRRHHCRSCGHVVCGSCSTHSYRIDALHKRPVRVCDPCFSKLTGVCGADQVCAPPDPRIGGPVGERSDSSDSEEEENGKERIHEPTFYREQQQ